MTFQQLLDGAEVVSQSGDASVSGLNYDSRRIQAGDAFVAILGGTLDGNRYIDQAIARGAVAVVTDSPSQKARVGVAWAEVREARRALARLSSNLYGRPAEKLAVTGITGTNGKSTTAFLLESILESEGKRTCLLGTIEYRLAGKILPAPHTTPESLELNRFLARALAQGVTEAVVEVSSHALAQQRVFALRFDVAVFTNLTRDHLDYHKTMEEYFAAKQTLFVGCGSQAPRVAVLNGDDESGQRLVKVSESGGSQVLTYGRSRGDVHAEKIRITLDGTHFDLVTPEETIPIRSALVGKVNLYNILASAAASYARGAKGKAIEQGVARLLRVPGRFERVDCGQRFTVVVDYAHTDDALRNLTTLARELVSPRGRVITVFGCGGERDRAKRPLMGQAAGQGSDFVVLTSDNPRGEDPRTIINDALVGLARTRTRYTIEPDRRAAISIALGEAKGGDIVLIAGKGHEKIQICRAGPVPFDDVQVARELLAQAGYDGATRASGGHPS